MDVLNYEEEEVSGGFEGPRGLVRAESRLGNFLRFASVSFLASLHGGRNSVFLAVDDVLTVLGHIAGHVTQLGGFVTGHITNFPSPLCGDSTALSGFIRKNSARLLAGPGREEHRDRGSCSHTDNE